MKQTLKGGKHQGKYYARIVLRKKKTPFLAIFLPSVICELFFWFPRRCPEGKGETGHVVLAAPAAGAAESAFSFPLVFGGSSRYSPCSLRYSMTTLGSR